MELGALASKAFGAAFDPSPKQKRAKKNTAMHLQQALNNVTFNNNVQTEAQMAEEITRARMEKSARRAWDPVQDAVEKAVEELNGQI